MFRGKKYKKIAESIDRNKAYDLAEAVQILKKSELKFDQTVEIHFNLGVDPKHSDQAQTLRPWESIPRKISSALRSF